MAGHWRGRTNQIALDVGTRVDSFFLFLEDNINYSFILSSSYLFSLASFVYFFRQKAWRVWGMRTCRLRSLCNEYARSMYVPAHARTRANPPAHAHARARKLFFFFPSHPDMCAISVSAELVYLTTQARRTGLKGSVVRNLFALTSRNEST